MHRTINQLLMLFAMLFGLAYLIYRTLYTFNPDQLVFSAVFYLAEVHGLPGFVPVFL